MVRFKMEAEGEALLGEGANFCHGLGWVGVVLTSVSTLGDISICFGLPAAMLLPAVEVEGKSFVFFLDISSNLAALDENTDVKMFCFVLIFIIGSGGLMRLLFA